MANYLPFIKSVIKTLDERKLLTSLDKVSAFHDEPKLYSYSSSLDISLAKKYSDGRMYEVVGGGFSFFSREEALSKCLGELLERSCIYSYPKNKIYFKEFNKIKRKVADLTLYPKFNSSSSPSGWVKGFQLTPTSQTECYLPAQSVYIPYMRENNEVLLMEPNSNGAAGGFLHEDILLAGIYEIIERDAFMSIYLGKIPPIKIDLSSLYSKKIKRIALLAYKYNLHLNLFEITSDIKVPTYLATLIDKSKFGPTLSIGLGTDFNKENAIISSLQEAFAARQWTRHHMILRAKESNTITIHTKYITTPVDRALLWSHPSMISHLAFLFDQPKQNVSLSSSSFDTKKSELATLLSILSRHSLKIYYTDISTDFVEECGFRVYKILIPQLHTFHLNEYNKEIRLERIAKVASKYNFQIGEINTIPHPML